VGGVDGGALRAVNGDGVAWERRLVEVSILGSTVARPSSRRTVSEPVSGSTSCTVSVSEITTFRLRRGMPRPAGIPSCEVSALAEGNAGGHRLGELCECEVSRNIGVQALDPILHP